MSAPFSNLLPHGRPLRLSPFFPHETAATFGFPLLPARDRRHLRLSPSSCTKPPPRSVLSSFRTAASPPSAPVSFCTAATLSARLLPHGRHPSTVSPISSSMRPMACDASNSASHAESPSSYSSSSRTVRNPLRLSPFSPSHSARPPPTASVLFPHMSAAPAADPAFPSFHTSPPALAHSSSSPPTSFPSFRTSPPAPTHSSSSPPTSLPSFRTSPPDPVHSSSPSTSSPRPPRPLVLLYLFRPSSQPFLVSLAIPSSGPRPPLPPPPPP